MRLLLGVFLPVLPAADPISVVVSNQTISTTAQAGSCMNIGVKMASCSVMGATANSSVGLASQSGEPPSLQLSAMASTISVYATSRAEMNETLTITGGAGTGYLNLSFQLAQSGPGSAYSILANGQHVQMSGSPFFAWGVVPFTFGQAFQYASGPLLELISGMAQCS